MLCNLLMHISIWQVYHRVCEQ